MLLETKLQQIYNYSSEVAQICEPLFRHSKITTFYYVRHYDNGDSIVLTNCPDWVKHLLAKHYRIVAPIPNTILNHKFHYLIPLEGAYSQAMHDAQSFFKLGYAIDLIFAHKGYFELYAFVGEASNYELVNFYFNHLDILTRFTRHFNESAKPIIDALAKQHIQFPLSMRPLFNSSDLILDKSKDLVDFSNNAFSLKFQPLSLLSPRENKCLELMVLGQTAKETAQTLSISHRTVEYHIENIKNKTGLRKKSQLIKAATEKLISNDHH